MVHRDKIRKDYGLDCISPPHSTMPSPQCFTNKHTLTLSFKTEKADRNITFSFFIAVVMDQCSSVEGRSASFNFVFWALVCAHTSVLQVLVINRDAYMKLSQ